jgi:hypothetical protein|tara:strand:- start:211 stop:525 length:315 start_codon:yes stop_codon:yes gene_type:complete
MAELLIIIALVGVVFYWQAAVHSKDIARQVARRECQRCGVQFLDQSVHQSRLSMSRDTEGHWRLWRDYRFEYSEDGETRRQGTIVMLGQRVVSTRMETFSPIIH